MDCEHIKSNIPSLLAGELSADERNEAIKHVEICSAPSGTVSAPTTVIGHA
jgi:hypothetical protein